MAQISGLTVSIDSAILEILEDITNRLNKLESNIADVKENKPFVIKGGRVYISEAIITNTTTECEKSYLKSHDGSWVLFKDGGFFI